MTLQQIEQAVASLSLMLTLADHVKERVVAAFKEVSQLKELKPGDGLFAEGDSDSDEGYILLSGSVKVETADGFSTQVFPPELLGEMKQFHFGGSAERMADVSVIEPSEVLQFSWARLHASLSERLDANALAEFENALQSYAWMHFLEQEDEG
ncbi:MAG: cyclic nucleotide-binding domain-containing protein [Candidatus Hydrogenedentes bacterium]|nr:cyclic nucleotide-binding domain-containing protein [Candidatus Hydrogenedentota bacterium]